MSIDIRPARTDHQAWTELANDPDFDTWQDNPEHVETVEKFRGSEAFDTLRRLIDGLFVGRIDHDAAAKARKLTFSVMTLFLRLSGMTARRYDFTTDRAALEQDGFAVDAIERFLTPDEHNWTQRLQGAVFPSDDARRRVLESERYLAFQSRAIIDKELFAPDPLTGEPCRVRDGFYAHGRGFYTYKGRETFHLVTGGGGNGALCLFIPALSVQIILDPGLARIVDGGRLEKCYSFYLLRAVRAIPAFEDVIDRDEDDCRKNALTLIVGQAENFAHHVWNFYPGIEKLCHLEENNNIDHILSAGTEFYGPLTGIFPEFSPIIERIKRGGVMGGNAFDCNGLFLQPGGYFITHDLKARIMDAAREAKADDAATDVPPVIWFGLRVGSRSWVNQENEIPRIMATLHDHHPEIAFAVDGYSMPVGHDEISEKWVEARTDLESLAADIVAKAPLEATVINLLNGDLFDATLLTRRVIAYVAPIGTAQHKVGWFTDSPGLIYSSPTIRRIAADRRPGTWEAEGITVARYITGEVVDAGERRSVHDQRTQLENIRLDPDAIAEALLAIVENRKHFGAVEPVHGSVDAKGH